MFDENKFQYVLAVKNKTLSQVADAMGISVTTLYRKMNGKSDFYRKEIQKYCEFIGEKGVIDIFFA